MYGYDGDDYLYGDKTAGAYGIMDRLYGGAGSDHLDGNYGAYDYCYADYTPGDGDTDYCDMSTSPPTYDGCEYYYYCDLSWEGG